jgi:hypothetical protein
MKRSIALTLIGSIFVGGGALAADSPQRNAFAISGVEMTVAPGASIPHEDVSSPFAEMHPLEERIHLILYGTQYDSMATPPPFSAAGPLPETDSEGRPLWFDAETGRDVLANVVAGLLSSEQFDNLDRLFNDWSGPRQLGADGRWRLSSFERGVSLQFAGGTAWDSGYQLIQRWRTKSPGSRAAAIAEAIYWKNYAWSARGAGYANTVSDEGWKLYEERLAKAEATLVESQRYASTSPLWDYEFILVAQGLNWPVARRLDLFKGAYQKEKFFVANYAAFVRGLAPKWGGDWKTVDEFIRSAVELTKSAEGRSMYARLYMAVDGCDCDGFDLLRDTMANWPDLKQSFDDLIRLYPHSGWLINRYAAYACLAGDRDAFLDLRFRIGNATIPGAWPRNHSLDLCEHEYPARPL